MSKKLTTTQELTLLRSAVVGLVGRDREGTYRPELVSELLEGLQEKPTQVFQGEAQFLAELDAVS